MRTARPKIVKGRDAEGPRRRRAGYFSFASKLPVAGGVFIETRQLIRRWAGPRQVFLVGRRPPL